MSKKYTIIYFHKIKTCYDMFKQYRYNRGIYMIQTIIFDVDDTLYDQALPFKQTAKLYFERYFSEQELDHLYISSRAFSDELFHQSTTGEVTVEDLQVYRITEAAKLYDIHLTRTQALDFQAAYLAEQKKIQLFKEVEKLIQSLYCKHKQIAILTNGEAQHQAMKIKKLKLDRWIPSEQFFISGALGIAKPDIRVFQHIQKQLSLDTASTIYIGDSFEHDIIGAKQAGWQALWMNHRKRKMPPTTIRPDYEVQHPNELLALFEDTLL